MEVHIMDKKRTQQIAKQIECMLADRVKVSSEGAHKEMEEE